MSNYLNPKQDGHFKDLSFLTFVEVLNDNRHDKILTILAKDASDKMAVILVSKTAFESDESQKILSKCNLKLDLKNDCYHTLNGLLPSEYQPVRYSLTYPASAHHISKARAMTPFFRRYCRVSSPGLRNLFAKCVILLHK